MAAVLGAAAIATTATASQAAAQVRQPVSSARLQGKFVLLGKVTIARNVPGERAGAPVIRTWTFTSGCATGPCATVGLLRGRPTGTDVLVLKRMAPAYYAGTGAFYAPLRCGRRTYPRGELVPFTIAVRITGAELVNGGAVASSIAASYINRSRTNRTACFAVLGHDAASYHGQFQPPPAPPPPPPPPPPQP
jgi:hypothetical protein